MNKERIITAQQFDHLLERCDPYYQDMFPVTPKIAEALEGLISVLADLAPLKDDCDTKAVWLEIPSGPNLGYDPFSDWESNSFDGFEARQYKDYSDKTYWYRLSITEKRDKDGFLRFRTVSIGNRTLINAEMDEVSAEDNENEIWIVKLCVVLTLLAADVMQKLRSGTYNDHVKKWLPYWFRTGVLSRSVVMEKEPQLIRHATEENADHSEMSEYIGIVPYEVEPKNCEDLFPPEYGRIDIFIHVYLEEIINFWPFIKWLPFEQAELL